MSSRIFIIQQPERETLRIRAASYTSGNMGGGFWLLEFLDGQKKGTSAEVMVQLPFSVVPMDMLYDSLADTLLLPLVPEGTLQNGVEFLHDPLFTEEEKSPFTIEERRLLISALEASKQAIKATFETTSVQQARIDEKLIYLAEKVAELDKFNWKRLFISTLVGVSVDLCFGTVIPASLLAVFTEVLSHFGEKGLKRLERNHKPEA